MILWTWIACFDDGTFLSHHDSMQHLRHNCMVHIWPSCENVVSWDCIREMGAYLNPKDLSQIHHDRSSLGSPSMHYQRHCADKGLHYPNSPSASLEILGQNQWPNETRKSLSYEDVFSFLKFFRNFVFVRTFVCTRIFVKMPNNRLFYRIFVNFCHKNRSNCAEYSVNCAEYSAKWPNIRHFNDHSAKIRMFFLKRKSQIFQTNICTNNLTNIRT